MKRDVKEQDPKKIGRPRGFDRKEAINQAMLMFWRHGYETTSMTLLSKQMKMNAPSIYATFGDKKSLFLEALHRYVGDLSDIQSFLEKSPTAFDGAMQMLKMSAARFTEKGAPCGCMLASATASGSDESSDVQQVVGQIRSKIENLLKDRIQQDLRKGLLTKEVSADSLACFTMAIIQGMSVLARDGASRRKLNQLAETSMGAWRQASSK